MQHGLRPEDVVFVPSASNGQGYDIFKRIASKVKDDTRVSAVEIIKLYADIRTGLASSFRGSGVSGGRRAWLAAPERKVVVQSGTIVSSISGGHLLERSQITQSAGSAHGVSYSDIGDVDFDVTLPGGYSAQTLGVQFKCRWINGEEDLSKCAWNRGVVVVTHVSPGSDGEKLGIKIGDRVESVEGLLPDFRTIYTIQGGYSGQSRLERNVWALTRRDKPEFSRFSVKLNFWRHDTEKFNARLAELQDELMLSV